MINKQFNMETLRGGKLVIILLFVMKATTCAVADKETGSFLFAI